jgi:GLPGLI family protein
MKKISLFLILISSFSFSQKKEINGLVYYGEYNCINCGAKNGREIVGSLVFDKQESFYSSEQKDSLNFIYKNAQKEVYHNTDNEGGVIYSSPSDENDATGYQVQTTKDSVFSYFEWHSTTHGNFHYIKEKREKINWKLDNQTKRIGNFNCLKATGEFRGRIYTAWYTLEIPAPYGPWKLQGLPGLIIEAYNENQEIYFYTKKIEYPSTLKEERRSIETPNEFKYISFKESLVRMEILKEEVYMRLLLMLEGNKNVKVNKSTLKDIFKEFEE